MAKQQSRLGDRCIQGGLFEVEDRDGDGSCPAVAVGEREGQIDEE